MATEKQAHRARQEHSSSLRELGAHAIAVDQLEHQGKRTFAVIAFIEHKPSNPLPNALMIKSGKKTIEVPMVWRVTPMAKLE